MYKKIRSNKNCNKYLVKLRKNNDKKDLKKEKRKVILLQGEARQLNN